MTEHVATVEWSGQDARFTDGRYSREHVWRFDGGVEVPASASPHVVPLPYANPANVDPEEAFVAALSSCHMLWFLSLAAKQRFTVEHYLDQAIGTMEENADGRLAITRVVLRPQIQFAGALQPTREQLARLHEEAHDNCFLARSVKSRVLVEMET
jgi:organic hydroperoxide reductase OsmC/OhrA